MKTVVSRALKRFGFRRVLMGSGALSATFLAVIGLFTIQTPAWVIIAVLFGGGLFRSLQFTSLNTLAVVDINPVDMSNATTIIQMAQQVSRSVGVGLGALSLGLLSGGVMPTGHIDSQLFLPVYLGFGILGIISTSFFRGLASDVGSEVSGQTANSGS